MLAGAPSAPRRWPRRPELRSPPSGSLTLGRFRSYTALSAPSGPPFPDGFEMTITTTNRTFSPRPRDIERRWYVVDGDGAVLGRLASEVAKILRGKHKPIFAPPADTGDHVIVVNAKGIPLTGG